MRRLILVGLTTVIFAGALIGGIFFYYQSRRIPDIDEEHLVTTLPLDIKNVLGTKTGPKVSPEFSIKIPILLYHYVEYVKDKNDTIRQKLNIDPYILTSQIETLKTAGYTFITPSDLADGLAGKRKLPPKVVMLTFDDGYMDFYTDVFPILKKEQVKAVAYIVPDFLNRPNFMFTFQLQEIAKSPLIEIGAHTMNHLWLKGMDKQKAEYEIAQSRKSLQDMLHLPINSFAYPYGAFDKQTMELVQSAGFTDAVSTVPGIIQTPHNRYFLYRLRPGGRTGEVLLSFLAQDTFKPW